MLVFLVFLSLYVHISLTISLIFYLYTLSVFLSIPVSVSLKRPSLSFCFFLSFCVCPSVFHSLCPVCYLNTVYFSVYVHRCVFFAVSLSTCLFFPVFLRLSVHFSVTLSCLLPKYFLSFPLLAFVCVSPCVHLQKTKVIHKVIKPAG